MKGCQLAVLTACAAPKMKIRIAATLISTIALLVSALSLAPRTRIQLSTISSRNAGTLKIAPVGLPSTNTGFESDRGQVEAEDVIEQIVKVRPEAHRDRHVRRRRIRGSDPTR